MTSTPWQSAAFDRIVAPWPAKIAAFLAAIVEIIVTIAENICNRRAGARHLLPQDRAAASGAAAGVVPAHDAEARDHSAGMCGCFRHRASFLPPFGERAQALARQRAWAFYRAVMTDLGGISTA